ncbi:MAG TPA: sulfatase, partial [Oceanipulchritudo sp.]|nr:sulfatase [Oceanipulchritudo sp.]
MLNNPFFKRVLPLISLGMVAIQTSAAPNIVLMVVDDLGWKDLGAYGSELYQTPHADALARSGLSFSNAYAASPLCSPTRASILTGQTPARLRLTMPDGHKPEVVLDPQEQTSGLPGLPMTIPVSRTRLPLDSITISQILRDAGYRTAFMGKWHLGSDPFLPENFGFERVVGGRHFPGPPPPGFFGPWDPEVTNLPLVEGSPNADDVLGDEAVRFIEATDGRPFFLALWFFNVHAPFQGKPELIEKYRPLAEKTIHQKSAIMGAMVETMDQNLGKVTAALERLGLAKDTLIIFTSDNGGNMYNRPEGVNPTSNFPLKAGKGNNYEGGSRVPMIISWPGHVAANQWTETIAISYDIFPTLVEVSGLKAPDNAVLDGISLVPAFSGDPMRRPPILSLFGHLLMSPGNVPNVWMRDGKWKLLRFFNAGPDQVDRLELYDLRVDPGERSNLAGVYPDVADQMNRWLDDYLHDARALLPRRNPDYDAGFSQGGISIQYGGLMTGGETSSAVNIISREEQVRFSYLPGENEQGQFLELKIATNCATRLTVEGCRELSCGGTFPVTPDTQWQLVRVALGHRCSGDDPITIVLNTEQPGRTQIEGITLSEGSEPAVQD